MMFNRKILLIAILPALLGTSCSVLFGQAVIQLKNPSFEASPGYASLPGGWHNCAFNNESPPDIHPVKNGRFEVNQAAQHGRSYVGLVTRDNHTSESVGQQLSAPMQAGQCYALSLSLSRSDKLLSRSRTNGLPTNFNTPVVLVIWGGLSPCGRKFQLAASAEIDHADWKKYTFYFQPPENLSWITLEAGYADGYEGAYNGNLLLDNASAIVPISCETKMALVDTSKIEPDRYNYTNYEMPGNFLIKPFYSSFAAGGYYLDFRVVHQPTDINGLIADNCPLIGFEFGSNVLLDEYGNALKEIAVNILRHKNTRLIIGLPAVGNNLVKKRKKRLVRVFREIGLPKKKYEISTLTPDQQPTDWLCGAREIWLRLEHNPTGG